MNRHARGLLVAVVMLAAGVSASSQVTSFRPVTDAVLQNPPASDWLHFRRTYDGWGYSPLDQINRQNVGQLQLAWSWAMQPGNQQATPLVHDGVMYLANPGQHRSGVERRHRRSPVGVSPRVPGGDARAARDPAASRLEHLRRQDLREHRRRPSGRARRAHRERRLGRRGRRSQAAILVLGAARSSFGARSSPDSRAASTSTRQKCAITAHDARTGKEMWRTSTIAHPGQPGGDSWGDVPLMFRAGRRHVDHRQLRSRR